MARKPKRTAIEMRAERLMKLAKKMGASSLKAGNIEFAFPGAEEKEEGHPAIGFEVASSEYQEDEVVPDED